MMKKVEEGFGKRGQLPRIMTGLLLMGWVITMSGCIGKVAPATREAYETQTATWVGKSMDDLKKDWGLPNSTDKLTSGHILLEYRVMKPLGLGRKLCMTLFEVDPDGTILSFQAKGYSCRARPETPKP